jgi:hypothetical protein
MHRTWQGSATRAPAFLMNCRRRSLLVGVAAVPSRRGAGPKCRDLQPTHRARVKARLLGHELSWSPADAKRQGTTVAPCRICRRETLVGKDTLTRILRRGRADPLQVAPRRARKRRPAVMGRPGLAHRDTLRRRREARGERPWPAADPTCRARGAPRRFRPRRSVVRDHIILDRRLVRSGMIGAQGCLLRLDGCPAPCVDVVRRW